MSPITSHVLDTALGTPARGLALALDALADDGTWQSVATAVTNDDGRAPGLMKPGELQARTYRMTFHTGDYFEATERTGFYPRVEVIFTITAPEEHYHVPLLLSPYGYST